MLEKWESLTTRVEETQMATALHRELTTLRTEFKAAHDRLFSYEIMLEQPHVLDERINRITVRIFICPSRKHCGIVFKKRQLLFEQFLFEQFHSTIGEEWVWLSKKLNISFFPYFIWILIFSCLVNFSYIFSYVYVWIFTYIDCIKIYIYLINI